MAEKNGNIAWVKWIFTIVIITIFPLIIGAIVKNDCEGRARDIEIERRFTEADAQICKEANADKMAAYGAIADIRVTMAEIRTDLAYIKKQMTK